MVGYQPKFSSVKDLEIIFNDINTRLEDYFSSYNLEDEDIVYVQVSFRLLYTLTWSDLVIDKENENISYLSSNQIKTTQDTIAIPVITSEDDLGKCLPVILDNNNNNNIKEVSVILKDVKCNFLDIIIEKTKYIKNNHNDVITSFDKDYRFYYIKSNKDYILVVKYLGDGMVEILKYSISGVLINRIKDSFVGNLFVRSKGLKKNTYIYLE